MKKRFVGFALILAIVFSFNVMVVYAMPGLGCIPFEPLSMYICLPECDIVK